MVGRGRDGAWRLEDADIGRKRMRMKGRRKGGVVRRVWKMAD